MTDALFDAIDQTWPAARSWRDGPWRMQDGQGGGKRVSAAMAIEPVTAADVAQLDRAFATMALTSCAGARCAV